jgi:hypothetical protein
MPARGLFPGIFFAVAMRTDELLFRLPVLYSRKVKPARMESQSLEPHGLHSPKAHLCEHGYTQML